MGRGRWFAAALVAVLVGTSAARAAHEQDPCTALKQVHARPASPGEMELPPPAHSELIFACAGITRFVQKLDQLDQDMLILRARASSVEELATKETQTDPPRRYGNFIPAKQLAMLKTLVMAYYAPRASR